MDILDQVILVLNRALKKDPDAINDLFAHRSECNEALCDDESIQVRTWASGPPTVGVLGLLNGILGVDEDGWGQLVSVCEDDGRIIRFAKTKEEIKEKLNG